ncbi:nicotinamide riboside transporter PnuC [Pseudozobellia thermophila]|uniref:Nicotinamide riboside transporter PnuC n=1 Tax=Pseudozobellia thermophila TaxID=192903 RepID=A0A1M6AL75_9FLAO|nr:nicotinamide riboside transporter PnuC [Pseudozobellia thermophila]SHI37167.1 nicotinamide mononucleotide transporter [Pseudozobellia thermophila]
MGQIFDWLFAQYKGTPDHIVVLELVSVFFSLLSVIYSKRENILVFPTGIIGTGIAVYILWVYGLLGDMLINAYYFIMSIVGWYEWTRKVDDDHYIPVTLTTPAEKRGSLLLFAGTLVFVSMVYWLSDKFDTWTAYADILTTAIFFVGMWLMAKKKLENWVYWVVGDIITVPLYLYKGLIFSAILYFVLTIIAVFGYLAWKKHLNKSPQTLLR